MLTAVEVTGVGYSPLTMTLGSVSESIQIRDIDGLGPVKASITTQQLTNIAGEAVLGSTVGKRNIVFTLGLNPDWAIQTVEELRQLLYEYFIPTLPVTLQFTSTHLPTVQIAGIVEDMDPNMFSQDPEIVVSIICTIPEFVAVDQTTETGLVFAASGYSAINSALVSIQNPGNAPTGVNIKVEANSAHPSYFGEVDIYTVAGSGALKLFGDVFSTIGVNIVNPWRFEVNSIPGNKYAKRVNGDWVDETNLLNYVTGDNAWPVLIPGENRFGIKAANAGQAWTMTYFARYVGL